MGIQFHDTVLGQHFFCHHVPALIKAVESVAVAIKDHTDAVKANTAALKEYTRVTAQHEYAGESQNDIPF